MGDGVGVQTSRGGHSEAEVAWLAGILEGEGYFAMASYSRDKPRYRYPTIVVNMTDRDIIERVASMFGGSVYDIRPRPGLKPPFRARATGRNAAAWMRLLYPWLGTRRRARIDEVLTEYDAREPTATRHRRSCIAAAVNRERSETGQFVRATGDSSGL